MKPRFIYTACDRDVVRLKSLHHDVYSAFRYRLSEEFGAHLTPIEFGRVMLIEWNETDVVMRVAHDYVLTMRRA